MLRFTIEIPSPGNSLRGFVCFRYLHCLQTAHDLRCRVALHFPDEHCFFPLLRHDLRIGKRQDAMQNNLAGWDELSSLGICKAEGNTIAQLELPHPPASRYRHDLSIVRYADNFQYSLGFFCVINNTGTGTRRNEASKIGTDRMSLRKGNIKGLKWKRRCAAEMKTAGSKQETKSKQQN